MSDSSHIHTQNSQERGANSFAIKPQGSLIHPPLRALAWT